ncbi:hypothetical protein HMPREF1565_3353 [Providencia alcalifaciens RIMD 1656011]|uniref:Uncharacterized protein n=1 Tax=Providencia alcalifaciens DSM 30120 TaxID=520999 RepID=B6XK87_9GAMM|nr:hypothetical protein PROVALCAL_03798 [Providencia alcalifaciens DSM 30120]EUC96566.1 hypothetical protein HMPREF1567_3487 [Providencia alcalifaciens PAL-2]EUD03082.1 hypothetical protein HMPREF1565_3353 [Providencia alcalifaciens RIMD 1656011]EUD05995.1 hypothetical protein HMPREF1564_2623 [Providencia alcalifaciens R90-1475]
MKLFPHSLIAPICLAKMLCSNISYNTQKPRNFIDLSQIQLRLVSQMTN